MTTKNNQSVTISSHAILYKYYAYSMNRSWKRIFQISIN